MNRWTARIEPWSFQHQERSVEFVLGLVRASLGFASDNLLIFAAGGLALAQFDYGYNWPPDPNQIYHGQALYPGLSLGGGVDYAVSDSITLRAEYIYDNFSAHRFIFQGTDALSYYRAIDDVSFATHTVRVGVAYRF